jgi:hypothetical protein
MYLKNPTSKMDNVNVIASANDINDKAKYSVAKNPTGLYYRLHILNVGVSDVKKYRCNAVFNKVTKNFYLKSITFTLSSLYTLHDSLLLPNPHCRTASPPSTTYT